MASRLAHNILEYVKDQEFVDAEDAQTHLKVLFDGAFGIEEHVIWLYRAPQCDKCGKYVARHPNDFMGQDEIVCGDCMVAEDLADDELESVPMYDSAKI